MKRHTLLFAVLILILSGCALWLREPLRVSVAGLESLPGQGLEARFTVQLRIQNPNDKALSFNGISLSMDLAGKSFASGVSDQSGTVPRFGEIVVAVPVTVPALAMVRQAIGLAQGERRTKIDYEVRGRLGGAATFETLGDIPLPAGLSEPAR
jgi:LEA14-like dessication related protein